MFRFSFKLHEHGWATLTIGDDETTIELDVSYIFDTFCEFAFAARDILRGQKEASFNVLSEPEIHKIVITHEANFVRLCLSSDKRPRLILTCSLREFCNIAINALRRVLDEHGEADYRVRWQRDFPTREYRDLLELRRSLLR